MPPDWLKLDSSNLIGECGIPLHAPEVGPILKRNIISSYRPSDISKSKNAGKQRTTTHEFSGGGGGGGSGGGFGCGSGCGCGGFGGGGGCGGVGDDYNDVADGDYFLRYLIRATMLC